MVFKHGGYASDVTWKYIKLVYARGAKLEDPYFGFNCLDFDVGEKRDGRRSMVGVGGIARR